ncbi:MAG: RidA family protein [Bacteroidales bacterium]|nr:RidA family protein [Bacteroidales bacterium]
MKQIIATTNAPAAIGAYSQAVKIGNMLFASGQLGINPATGELPATFAEQAEQSLKNVQAILAEAGLDFSNVVKATVFMANMSDFAALNEVYGRYFVKPYPARSAVAVKELPKGALVEIEVIAAAE